jgi:hypothetical protein
MFQNETKKLFKETWQVFIYILAMKNVKQVRKLEVTLEQQ